MDTYEFKPTEDLSLAKATQSGEAEALASATFEPAAFVEGTGEVQPAEALQVSLEVMIASVPVEVESSPPARPANEAYVPEYVPPVGPGMGDSESSEEGIPRPEEPGVTDIMDIPGIGAVPGMHEAQTVVRDIPPKEEEIPIPPHADVEDAVTKPPSEVIVEGGLPMGSVPGDETSGESKPAASDDSKEWGAASTPTVRGETAVPTDLPQEGVVIPPTLPGRGEGRARPGAGGAGEAPLPGTGRVEYEEQPERLDPRLPDSREPLTGVGAKGNVDATKGFGPEMPFDEPEIDMVDGMGAGGGKTPRVVGNMPMGGGRHGSGMSDFDEPDLPTGGGYHSSGSGPALSSGRGRYAEEDMFTGEDEEFTEDDWSTDEEKSTRWFRGVGNSKQGCDDAAGKISDVMKMDDNDGGAYFDCQVGDTTHSYYCDDKGVTEGFSPFVPQKSQEPDDSNPHPYTGGSMGPATPEKDNDTGKVLPDADLDGFDGTVWKADPDSTDDSGRFYGGIFGDDGKYYPDSGGARPIDPKRKTEDEAEAADDAG